MKPLSRVPSVADGACGRVRRLLDSYLDGELTVETNHEVLDHLGRCPACAAESAARQRLEEAVRRVSAVDALPPAELAARIREEVKKTRPSPGPAPWAALLAAAVAVAAGVAVTRHRPAVETRAAALAPETLAAVTQVHCALGNAWPESAPELASVAAGAAELGPLLPDLAARVPDYGIVAAHRCIEKGVSVLHVILRKRGATGPASLASLVVVSGSAGAAEGMEVTSRDGFTLVAEAGSKGTAFLVTSEGAEAAKELGVRALPALKPVTT